MTLDVLKMHEENVTKDECVFLETHSVEIHTLSLEIDQNEALV